MITFSEYSQNLDQIKKAFEEMSRGGSPSEHKKWILGFVPVDSMVGLPEESRRSACLVLRRILKEDLESWNSLGGFVKSLWDQPFSKKTLGRDLLNMVSAVAMARSNADFFVSYSGEMSRGGINAYVKGFPRVFSAKNVPEWKRLEETLESVSLEYTKHFNNYVKRYIK